MPRTRWLRPDEAREEPGGCLLNRWLPTPMRSVAGAESATEPCAWSATEPRGWERRFHSWVKRLAGGAVQNAPG